MVIGFGKDGIYTFGNGIVLGEVVPIAKEGIVLEPHEDALYLHDVGLGLFAVEVFGQFFVGLEAIPKPGLVHLGKDAHGDEGESLVFGIDDTTIAFGTDGVPQYELELLGEERCGIYIIIYRQECTELLLMPLHKDRHLVGVTEVVLEEECTTDAGTFEAVVVKEVAYLFLETCIDKFGHLGIETIGLTEEPLGVTLGYGESRNAHGIGYWAIFR